MTVLNWMWCRLTIPRERGRLKENGLKPPHLVHDINRSTKEPNAGRSINLQASHTCLCTVVERATWCECTFTAVYRRAVGG